MKVCLIIPPSGFLLDERVFVSLGILRIASVLEQSGARVDVMDLSGVVNFLDVVKEYALVNEDVYFYGLTATTPQIPAASNIARVIHQTKKDAKVILGGPHVTLLNSACKKAGGKYCRSTNAMREVADIFDTLVAGDGEESVFAAISHNSRKLIDADDPRSPLFLSDKMLNELPWPARHLVDMDSYHYSIDGLRATSLIAQLGCPFSCGFCGGRQSPSMRKIRTRTAENIAAEMTHIFRTTGIRGFMLYDDELNVNKGLVHLMKMIIQTQKNLGIEWRLRGFVKSELFTNEQAAAMYEAGFRELLVGFESGSPAILEAINKKATVEENSRCLDIAHSHGIRVKALMSVGHPGESAETIEQTERWLIEKKPDQLDISLITCYPGTAYHDNAVYSSTDGVWVYTHAPSGARLYQMDVDYVRTANYYKGNPDGGYHSYVYTDFLSREELVNKRNQLESTVRNALNIPFYAGNPAVRYEHSMGMNGAAFPSHLLRSSR